MNGLQGLIPHSFFMELGGGGPAGRPTPAKSSGQRFRRPFSKGKSEAKSSQSLPRDVVAGDDHFVDMSFDSASSDDSSGSPGMDMFAAWAAQQMGGGDQASPSASDLHHFLFRSQGGSSDSFSSQDVSAQSSPSTGAAGAASARRGHGLSTITLTLPEKPATSVPAGEEALTSVGSSLHASGQCKPCRFIALASGCRNQYKCPYCHNEEHLTDPTSAERPPKGVRSGYRKSVNQVLESDMPEDQKRFALKQLAQRSPYLRVLVRRIMPEMEEGEAKSRAKAEPKNSSKTDRPEKPREPGLQPSTLISL